MFSWKNRKNRQYNSRIYDLTNTKDFAQFCVIVDTLNDFDFAVHNVEIVYNGDYTRSTIHVETKQEMMEIWLVKHQFEEA